MSSPGASVSSRSRCGPHQVGHQRGQAVVVAEADLLVGHGVVLVDHRDHAELDEMAQRAPGVQVLGAVDEVQRRQQDLAGQDPVRVQPVLPRAHEPVLADGGDGLEHGRVGRALLAPPQRGPPGRDGARRHHHDGVTGGAGVGDLAAQAVHGGGGDRRRAHLDHDGAGGGGVAWPAAGPAVDRALTARPR